MDGDWADYAEQARREWDTLGVELDPRVFRTGVRLERVARRLEMMYNDALTGFRADGLRGMEDFRLLALLARSFPHPTNATDASRLLGLSKAATSSRVDRFVTDGLAERSESQFDRRTVDVVATEQGIEVAMTAVRSLTRVHARLLAGLEDEHLHALESALASITARFE